MALTIRFEVYGTTVLARGLTRFGERIADFTPVWLRIRNDFFAIEAAQFASQGGRTGMPWAPLKLSYARWKQRYFPGRPILVRTGFMSAELTGGIRVEISPQRLAMTPTLEPAIYHQMGTNKMARRKVVSLTEGDKERWMKYIHRFVYESAKAEGLTP